MSDIRSDYSRVSLFMRSSLTDVSAGVKRKNDGSQKTRKTLYFQYYGEVAEWPIAPVLKFYPINYQKRLKHYYIGTKPTFGNLAKSTKWYKKACSRVSVTPVASCHHSLVFFPEWFRHQHSNSGCEASECPAVAFGLPGPLMSQCTREGPLIPMSKKPPPEA